MDHKLIILSGRRQKTNDLYLKNRFGADQKLITLVRGRLEIQNIFCLYRGADLRRKSDLRLKK